MTPTLVAAFPRGEDETLKGEMKKHYRAADLLYRGLVVPSEHSWTSGAKALAGDPTELELRRGPGAKPEIETLARRLHDLAEEAGKAGDPKARIGGLRADARDLFRLPQAAEGRDSSGRERRLTESTVRRLTT